MKCKPFIKFTPMANQNGPIYYTPSQIISAYGLNLITTPSNKPRGYGIKIAVVGAYHYSNLQSDLNKYCSKFGLAPITLNIVNQAGNVSNIDWALEICLDVQMINTVAPGATVYVIEAKSDSLTDISNAINAASKLGVNIISMSFGSNEYQSQRSSEYLYSNSNITFIAASGDSVTASYPSTSSNVVSVGGSTLNLNPNNTRLSETTWSSAGTGVSLYTPKPAYQNLINNGKYRNVPDISLIANPDTGFTVYCSIQGGYFIVGGTSAATPLMSGIVAVCNQLRKAISKPMLTSISTSPLCLQNYIYKSIYTNSNLYNSCMYDITSGTDGTYTAKTGYDIATGIGSIKTNGFCPQLVNY